MNLQYVPIHHQYIYIYIYNRGIITYKNFFFKYKYIEIHF